MYKTILYNNSSISYRIEGSGNTIVLIHGFAEDGHIWDEQLNAISTEFQVIIPDLPGSGKSAILLSDSIVQIADYAAVVHAILLQENIQKSIMLGHSMGGYITLAFAEKYPSLLQGFGLIHSTAFADSAEKKLNRDRGIALIDEYGAAQFIKTTTPNLFGAAFKTTQPQRIDALINEGKLFSNATLKQYYIAMKERADKCFVLKGNDLPVLFVIGTEDIAAPLEDVLQQVHLPTMSYIHILENTGHMGMWESSDKVTNYIKTFAEACFAIK